MEELAEACREQDHLRVLALAENMDAPEALRCRLVALIKLGHFSKALELFPEDSSLWEKAYCLYREKKHEQLEKMFESKIDGPEVALVHLRAQTHFRLRRYRQAAHELKSFEEKDYATDPDLASNIIASFIESGSPDLALKVKSAVQAPDLFYNLSCAYLDSGNWEAALQCILKATDLLKSSGAEDVADDLAAFSVQEARILQCQGNLHSALEKYVEVLHTVPAELDLPAVATAANNCLTLKKGDEKLFESTKRLSRAFKISQEKLTYRQLFALQVNKCVLAFHEKNFVTCLELASELSSANPNDDLGTLLTALVKLKLKQFDEAENLLKKRVSECPKLSLRCQLLLAHLHIESGRMMDAVEILRSDDLGDLKHEPAFVATIVSILESQNRIEEACSALDSACRYWKGKSSQDELKTLKLASGRFKFKHGLFDTCVADFEDVAMLEGGSKGSLSDVPPSILASLVIAVAQSNPERAKMYARSLPPVPGLQSVSFEALEEKMSVPVDLLRKRAKKDAETKDSAEGDSKELEAKRSSKAKKKRKIRYPKNFDPLNPGPKPDPERWLPRWQRSSFKKCLPMS